MSRLTMSQISYGLETPSQLLEKLIFEGAKLTTAPHPFDVFNFMVTAAVLNEWILQVYRENPAVVAINRTKKNRDFEQLPDETATWIIDRTCIPNIHCDIRRHVFNAMCISWDTANASKHYHWIGTSDVRAIDKEPIVTDFYQYFFTSIEPDLYIDYAGECYGLKQVKEILIQFYSGLLNSCGSGLGVVG